MSISAQRNTRSVQKRAEEVVLMKRFCLRASLLFGNGHNVQKKRTAIRILFTTNPHRDLRYAHWCSAFGSYRHPPQCLVYEDATSSGSSSGAQSKTAIATVCNKISAVHSASGRIAYHSKYALRPLLRVGFPIIGDVLFEDGNRSMQLALPRPAVRVLYSYATYAHSQ